MCQLQERVRSFHRKFGASRNTEVYLLDLVSEVGELAQEYLRSTHYGKKTSVGRRLSKEFAEELGDVLYSLLSLVEVTGYGAEALLDRALDKYRSRILARGGMGSSSRP